MKKSFEKSSMETLSKVKVQIFVQTEKVHSAKKMLCLELVRYSPGNA